MKDDIRKKKDTDEERKKERRKERKKERKKEMHQCHKVDGRHKCGSWSIVM